MPPPGTWEAASDAIDLPRPARLFLPFPTNLKECDKVMAQNQHRAFFVDSSEPSFDPSAHGIFVNRE